ncbi:MAG: UPF0175 family protein [Bacteroidota bacterium]
MGTITFNLPDTLDKERDEIIRFLAAKLYEVQKLTLTQAAEICGLKKYDFPEVLAKFNTSYFQYSRDDLLDEFK